MKKCDDCGKELTPDEAKYLEHTCNTCESQVDWYGDEDEEADEMQKAWDDCGKMPDGRCLHAGSEQCDFECPFRD